MSDDEDPYAVSSDSDDERRKGPPPKVAIEGAKDLKQLVGFPQNIPKLERANKILSGISRP